MSSNPPVNWRENPTLPPIPDQRGTPTPACPPSTARVGGAPRSPGLLACPVVPGKEACRGRLLVRRRRQGRPPGGRQRGQPGKKGAGAALRLQEHRHLAGLVGRGRGDRLQDRP